MYNGSFNMHLNNNTKHRIRTAVFALVAAGVVVLCIFIAANKKIKPIESDSWAMGSAVTLKIYTDDEKKAADLSDSAFSAAAKVDNALSATITDSDISAVNAAAGEPVKISAFTADKLSQSVTFCKTCAYNAADGSIPIDVTIGKLSSLWGFSSGNETVPSKEAIATALATADIFSVSVNTEENTAAIGVQQQLDLGAFGKGIAADEVCAALRTDEYPAIADIGGTILLLGNNPNSKDGCWNVGIRNPLDKTGTGYALTVDIDTSITPAGTAFVSTSGSYEKYFLQDDKLYHHILSTETGFPVETRLTAVTVISYHTGLEADGLSTVCFAMGLNEKSLRLLDSFSAQAVFIDSDGNYYATEGIREQLQPSSEAFNAVNYESLTELQQ